MFGAIAIGADFCITAMPEKMEKVTRRISTNLQNRRISMTSLISDAGRATVVPVAETACESPCIFICSDYRCDLR